MSRQYDTVLALILFGDRVQDTELDIVPTSISMPLALGAGFDNVQDLADQPTSPVRERGHRRSWPVC